MNTEWLIKLWDNGVLQLGVWETIYMTLLAALFSYLIGLPLGLLLRVTDADGIHPIKWLNSALGVIVNFLRSMPFLILMIAMLPVAKFIVGTSLGNKAVIVTLVIGLGLLLPGLGVSVRRLHDTNRSGWWILIALIPVLGWVWLFVLMLLKGDEGANNYGMGDASVKNTGL